MGDLKGAEFSYVSKHDCYFFYTPRKSQTKFIFMVEI